MRGAMIGGLPAASMVTGCRVGAGRWARLTGLGLGLCLVSGAATVRGQGQPEAPTDPTGELRLAGGSLQVVAQDGTSETVDVGCEARSVLRHGGRWYVACPDRVLAVEIVDGGVAVRGSAVAEGEVRELFVRGGQVWVELSRIEARPVSPVSVTTAAASGLPPSPAPPTGPAEGDLDVPPPPPPSTATRAPGYADSQRERVVGSVLERRPGEAIVSLGSADGVARGDRIAFFRVEDGSDQDGFEQERQELVLVGTVTGIAADRARVRLGINERVPEGTIVSLANRAPTDNRLAPPRVGGVSEVGFLVRPFLPVGELGIGLLGELYVGHWLDGPFHVGARLDPAGVAIVRGEEAGTLAGHVFAAVDLGSVEVGLGAGWSTFNVVFYESTAQADAPSILQVARLGARDGLHLAGRVAFVIVNDRFTFSTADVSVQFPFFGVVGQPTWGIVRGAGGSAGYYLGELGLRVLMSGNGDRGSTFLTVTLGGVGIWDEDREPCAGMSCWDTYDDQEYGGPAVGAGLEWRL